MRQRFSLPACAGFVQVKRMGSEKESHDLDEDGITVGSLIVAAIPFLALTVGPLFANRLEPRILGLPFLLAYLVFSVLMTPVFLFCADRLRKR